MESEELQMVSRLLPRRFQLQRFLLAGQEVVRFYSQLIARSLIRSPQLIVSLISSLTFSLTFSLILE